MPDALDKEEQLFQNLKDAGCSEEEIQNCMLDKEKGRISDLRTFLMKHKNCMIQEIHSKQKEVDCVDYLLYQIEKEEI
ncbi:hypothetical protein [Robinsoniella peoriensis]|uniref:hypothetical protein n=1 Tax=Robinsoniella peoriensis TaxID=180332 RepID=UPI0006942283|nr:hypothetical protein [Robinsoniella peoriensis]